MIKKPDILTATREDIYNLFPTLEKRVNKGDMGRVLCVCGSYDPCGAAMCGAAYFSAAAAYKCGAGIVEIFTHRKNYEALAARVPEAVHNHRNGSANNGCIVSNNFRKIRNELALLRCGSSNNFG